MGSPWGRRKVCTAVEEMVINVCIKFFSWPNTFRVAEVAQQMEFFSDLVVRFFFSFHSLMNSVFGKIVTLDKLWKQK